MPGKETYFKDRLSIARPRLRALALSLQTGCCSLSAKNVRKVSQCVENRFVKDK